MAYVFQGKVYLLLLQKLRNSTGCNVLLFDGYKGATMGGGYSCVGITQSSAPSVESIQRKGVTMTLVRQLTPLTLSLVRGRRSRMVISRFPRRTCRSRCSMRRSGSRRL
jgi:hypothetical protein